MLIAAVGLYGAFSSRRAAQAQFVVPDMLVTQMPNLSPAVIAEFSSHVFPSKAKQKNRRTRQLTSTLLSLTNAGLVNVCPGDAQRYRYLDLRVANAQQVAQAARSGPPLQHGQWTIALTGKQPGRLYPSQQALLNALFMISNKLRASQFDLAQMRAVLKNNESTSSGMRKFARAADKEYSSANLRTSCGGLANGCSMLLWLTIFAFSLYSVAHYNHWVWAVPGFCFIAAFMHSYNVSTCYTQRGLIVGGQMRAYCAYLTNSAMYAPTTPQQYRSDLANAAAVGMAAKVQDALVPLGAQMMASQQVAYSWDDSGPGLYNLDLTRDLDYGFQPVTSAVVWQTSSSVSYSSSSSSSGGFSSSSSYGGGSFGGR